MAWYLAPSLTTLRGEVNARWPRRDKTSDGTIGDTAHASSGRPENGGSDHNENMRGSVNAWDMDKDGVDVAEVIAAFEHHPSAHYWIFNRQIADKDDGWRRRPYFGSNPHDRHCHFSIRQTRAAEQDTRPWGLLPAPVEDDMPTVEEIWAAGFGPKDNRRTAGQLLAEARTDAAAARAEAAAVRAEVRLLAAAVSGVDEATQTQLQTDLDAIEALVASIPAETVEALGAVDSPEEIADRLRAALGGKAAAVGALLAGQA